MMERTCWGRNGAQPGPVEGVGSWNPLITSPFCVHPLFPRALQKYK